MVSPILVILVMAGVCVVAPVAIPTVTTYVTKKVRAFGNALKSENKLREASRVKEKDAKKEKRLVKKYYKSRIRAANRVLPSYDNLSKDNFYLKKLDKNETMRNKLIAQIGLAKVNNQTARAEKLTEKLENNFSKAELPNTEYNVVETVELAGQKIELPSNSIHCNVKSTADKFKLAIAVDNDAYPADSAQPTVAEITSKDDLVGSVSSVSKALTNEMLSDLMAEAYVEALIDEKNGVEPDYELTIYDTDNVRNKERLSHKDKFNSAESIATCAVEHLKLKDKDAFYDRAIEIANEKKLPITLEINGKKTKAHKTTKTKTTTTEKDLSDKEKIVCESETTKAKFDESLTRKEFAPTSSVKDFNTTISFGDTEKYSLKTQSKTREATFTVELMIEAYCATKQNEAKGINQKVVYESSWKEKGDKTFDVKSKSVTFNTSEEIKKYVLAKYSISESVFDKKAAEFDKELGLTSTPTEEKTTTPTETTKPEEKEVEVKEESPKTEEKTETKVKKEGSTKCYSVNAKIKNNVASLDEIYKTENLENVLTFEMVNEKTSTTEYILTTKKDKVASVAIFQMVCDVCDRYDLLDNMSKEIDYTIVINDTTYEIKNVNDLIKIVETNCGKNVNDMRTYINNTKLNTKDKEMEA